MKNNLKILFTCVGRRVELIQAFHNAALSENINLTIYGGDYSCTAPALQYCDYKIKLCKIIDTNYIPSLFEICKKEKIDAIIPTIDTDLLVLSENKELFKTIDTKVIVSDIDKIKICRDKRITAEFFNNINLYFPKTYDNYLEYDFVFPAFIKPKDGSSSINAYKINTFEELEEFSKIVPDYIIMPFIEGTEYTVDVMCDFDGNPIYITPRIRLAVRSGEVLKTKIDLEKKIIEEVETIIYNFKPCGPITIQLIREKKSEKDYYIEINPRFGGGAPLSMKAGADSAATILQLLSKRKVKINDVENEAIFSRFDQSIRIK